LVFVQYLASLAVVKGIRSYDVGWEDVAVCIKWPNDVYGKPQGTERWEKIGGIIVNSTYLENEYVLVVGLYSLPQTTLEKPPYLFPIISSSSPFYCFLFLGFVCGG
jgi:Biotin/lipoate A/B protein ligase family